MYEPRLIRVIRDVLPRIMAKELIEVQPMSNDAASLFRMKRVQSVDGYYMFEMAEGIHGFRYGTQIVDAETYFYKIKLKGL